MCSMNQIIATLTLLVFSQTAFAETPSLKLPTHNQLATPEQDDATIHDVTFIGQKSGWAVGDRGAIWNSEDSGNSWRFVTSVPGIENFSLRSVCFLTNHVGWITGGSVIPFSQTHVGIVLFTKDDGSTWQRLDQGQLPFLRKVQFFDLEHGIAVGESSPLTQCGVLQTDDGGATWTTLNAEASARWNTAAFFSPNEGVVLGKQGRHGLISNQHLRAGSNVTHGLQSLNGLSVDADGRCWLVGDGAYCLTSDNSGVSWSLPEGQLPKEMQDFVDLQCVAHVGEKIWMSGNPGTVIWHSPDAGRTWSTQMTGDPCPLKAIHFTNEQHGVAVGTMGRVCVTADGGSTWQNVRGANRRLACLELHAHATRPSLTFLTRWGKEGGYRIGVSLATRGDMGEDSHAASGTDVCLQHATMLSGGINSHIDWRLPLTIPGLARREDKLIEEWSMLTDRRLPDLLMGNLVAQIRTWRPDVLLLDEPPVDDIATQLIHKAVERAVQQARDSHYYPEQLSITGLTVWSVKKIVVQRQPGSHGEIQQSPFEIMPHLGTTLDLASAEAETCLGHPQSQGTTPDAYQVITTESEKLSRSSIFGDLRIANNSPARRDVPALRTTDFDELLAQANQRRTITGITASLTARPGGGAQLLAQIRPLMKTLSREQASAQLADLAFKYRQQNEWALTEETYAELITHYSDQPQAIEAMLWLTKFWTSTELNWQRLKSITGTSTNSRNQEAAVIATFEHAEEILKQNATRLVGNSTVDQLNSVIDDKTSPIIPTSGDLNSALDGSGQAASQRMKLLRRRQEMALAVITQLQHEHPRLFEEPELQFVLASLQRRRGIHKQADEVYDRFLQLLNDDPWHMAARGETWLLRPGALSPKPVVECKRTELAPILDGDLSDSCWSDANELQLGKAAVNESYVGASGGSVQFVGDKPMVMFSYDAQFLYIAASLPIEEGLPTDGPQHGGRTHDADLGLFDQLKFQFDVDRDYATYYEFEINQTGACREACWESQAYDPEWFICTKRDHSNWRVEAAIPLDHLVPVESVSGSIWAIGVTRIMPGIAAQSWTNSGAESPNAPLFGLLRFHK